ncbi:TIGR00366 family protein [Candidatus Palauibacter sp.]|uniref:TIGR00366 family protein n=1 Tax=Candidatus Palauibacter sp. TaxID=3101350 RepID=UPI003AF28534
MTSAPGVLDRLRDGGAALSRVTERWVPDAWVILMSLTVVALVLAVTGGGATIPEAGLAWGTGVWTLLELAMQFSIAMVAAHACASSPPVYRLLNRLASLPNPERPVQAVALAAGFSMTAGYLNWAFGLVGSALFVPFILKRNPRADVRLVIAAAYMGIGTVWQSGLSSSAPLILATPGNPLLEPGTGTPVVDRLYPVTETLFNPFNLGYAVAMLLVGLVAAMALHPRRDVVTLTEAEVEEILPAPPPRARPATTPAQRLDRFRGWTILAAALFAYPLIHSIITRGFGASWTINAYNTVFLLSALLLHGRPLSFLRACRDGVGAAWGVILQFPFYAGIFGVIQNTNLGSWLGEQFAEVGSTRLYPLVVYFYSGIMSLFIPSAGSKWMIEAPYVIPAGEVLDVSVMTTLLAYAYGDSAFNLIHPFWALPILAVTRRRFGEVLGYAFLIWLATILLGIVTMLVIPTRW